MPSFLMLSFIKNTGRYKRAISILAAHLWRIIAHEIMLRCYSNWSLHSSVPRPVQQMAEKMPPFNPRNEASPSFYRDCKLSARLNKASRHQNQRTAVWVLWLPLPYTPLPLPSTPAKERHNPDLVFSRSLIVTLVQGKSLTFCSVPIASLITEHSSSGPLIH